jgi:hypothetical protein
MIVRACPACGHEFVPWGTWRISRWSCLPCPRCRATLNRRIDAQFLIMLIIFCGVAVIPLLTFGATLWPLLIGASLGALVAWLFDVVTIRLVVAGQRRGMRGYEV